MKNCKTNYTTDEFEIIEMFRIYSGMRIDLKCIIVMSRVFEQTIERIKHLMR